MKLWNKIFGSNVLRVYISKSSDDGDSGVLTPEAALRVQTVYSCVRIISEDVGTLPIHIKKREGDTRTTLYTHPIARLLERPNPYMTGVDFRRAMIACLELRGNAYALISERDRQGYASRLDLLDPDQVTVFKGNTDIFYSIAGGRLLPSRDVIHLKGFTLDGIEGRSPITLLRENIENARNSKRFSKNLFKRDLKTSTVFSTDEKISPAQRLQLQIDLNKMLNKAKGVGSPIVLEGGMKASSLTLSPEDAQFVQYSLMTTDEIAAGYRVPPHKVGDWTRGTYSNNTQANLEYFTDCVRPLLEVCEAELNEKLLLEAERADVYVDINFKGLLRTDVKTQIENYRTMFNIGVYSANDIRALEDLAGYSGGDRYFVPANMMEITAERLITPQNDIQNNGQSE